MIDLAFYMYLAGIINKIDIIVFVIAIIVSFAAVMLSLDYMNVESNREGKIPKLIKKLISILIALVCFWCILPNEKSIYIFAASKITPEMQKYLETNEAFNKAYKLLELKLSKALEEEAEKTEKIKSK